MGTVKKILALHGWSTSTQKWGPFIEESVKRNINIKILPIPGLTKKVKKVWDLMDYVDWLATKIKTKKVILLGHSNGGRIALAFALKHPEKVRKLILIDSAGIYHNEIYLKAKRVLFKNLAKLGKQITSSEKLRNLLYKIIGESDYRNADPIQKQIMLNLISYDLTKFLKRIKTPTLIIWGKQDRITPLSDGKLMNKLINDSKLEVIKNAKHSPQFTNPEEVAKIIYEYI